MPNDRETIAVAEAAKAFGKISSKDRSTLLPVKEESPPQAGDVV